MSRTTRGRGWPVAIVAILGGTVALNVWVMRVASADPSMVVERDYYRKGVRWEEELAQSRRNAALGWSVAPALGPVGRSQRAELRVAVRDAAGAPLPGARVTVEAFAVARSANVYGETLVAAGDEYRASLPVTTAGVWELRFTVRRGADRFTAVRRVDAVRLAAGAG